MAREALQRSVLPEQGKPRRCMIEHAGAFDLPCFCGVTRLAFKTDLTVRRLLCSANLRIQHRHGKQDASNRKGPPHRPFSCCRISLEHDMTRIVLTSVYTARIVRHHFLLPCGIDGMQRAYALPSARRHSVYCGRTPASSIPMRCDIGRTPFRH